MPAAAIAIPAALGVIGAIGSHKAAKAQTGADNNAIAEQQRQFNVTQQNQAPWLQAGQNALGQLANPQANFMASPNYAFTKQQGMEGIQNQFAARGGAQSGNALKALNEFNSNLASGQYNTWWNQQAGLAGVGQTSANALGQIGANTSNNISSLMNNQGDARASGIMNSYASLGQQIPNAYNNYQLWKGYGSKNTLPGYTAGP